MTHRYKSQNEGRRTPNSRHDRDNLIGNNQTQMRQGGPNQGETSGPGSRRQRGA